MTDAAPIAALSQTLPLPPANASATVRPGGSAPAAATRAAEVAKGFEAAMLGPLVRQMLPSEDSSVWGGGAGKTWRSLYADEIANALAASGGVGIAAIIENAINDNFGENG